MQSAAKNTFASNRRNFEKILLQGFILIKSEVKLPLLKLFFVVLLFCFVFLFFICETMSWTPTLYHSHFHFRELRQFQHLFVRVSVKAWLN